MIVCVVILPIKMFNHIESISHTIYSRRAGGFIYYFPFDRRDSSTRRYYLIIGCFFPNPGTS